MFYCSGRRREWGGWRERDERWGRDQSRVDDLSLLRCFGLHLIETWSSEAGNLYLICCSFGFLVVKIFWELFKLMCYLVCFYMEFLPSVNSLIGFVQLMMWMSNWYLWYYGLATDLSWVKRIDFGMIMGVLIWDMLIKFGDYGICSI